MSRKCLQWFTVTTKLKATTGTMKTKLMRLWVEFITSLQNTRTLKAPSTHLPSTHPPQPSAKTSQVTWT